MQISNVNNSNFEYKNYMIEIKPEFYGVNQCSGIVEMSIIFEAKHKTQDKKILKSESLKEILEKIDDTYKLNNELETKIENKKEIYNIKDDNFHYKDYKIEPSASCIDEGDIGTIHNEVISWSGIYVGDGVKKEHYFALDSLEELLDKIDTVS